MSEEAAKSDKERDYFTKDEERAFREEVLDTFELLEERLGCEYRPSVADLRRRFLA